MLIGEDKQKALLHLPVAQNTVQLLSGFVYSLPVLTIHDEHETLRPGIVVPPQRPDLVLAADIPNVELHILVRYSLNVEPD